MTRPPWFTSLRRRLFDNWAQTWKLGRHWRIEVEWVVKARSFDFWIYDARRNER